MNLDFEMHLQTHLDFEKQKHWHSGKLMRKVRLKLMD